MFISMGKSKTTQEAELPGSEEQQVSFLSLGNFSRGPVAGHEDSGRLKKNGHIILQFLPWRDEVCFPSL